MTSQFRFKVVLVGEEGVGKTSLILRYINNSFTENYIPTLGVNFTTKDLQTSGIRLIIWDIGGQAAWKSKLPLYLKGADGAIISFDLTRIHTFSAIEDWISRIQTITEQHIPFVVVGNKKDLKKDRKVQEKEVKNFLKKQSFSIYFESSAKTGENIDTFFERIAQEIMKYKNP
ncbi:MAG TPA: Rab family GTPase [Candidatus Deferrimicrobium sp.]|nr:Rab family GTPase [Candidatus Deferrimicrobium sp.]